MSKWLKASSHLESSKRAQFRERQILSSAGRMIQGAPDLASSEGARFRERRIFNLARALRSRRLSSRKVVQNSKKSFFSRWRGQMNMIPNTARSVDTVTTLEITHKPRPPVRVPPLVSSTKDGKPYERPAHVQAVIRKMLSLPQSRWIGEAENLQNETLVFLICKTRHVNDDLCGGLLAGRAENPGHAWRNHWASLAR